MKSKQGEESEFHAATVIDLILDCGKWTLRGDGKICITFHKHYLARSQLIVRMTTAVEFLRKIAIVLSLALALFALPLTGRGCIVPKTGVTAGCADSCCMTKGCCAKPAPNTIPSSQPLAPGMTGQISLGLPPDARPLLTALAQGGVQRAHSLTTGTGPPRVSRLFLCTFLI